MITELLLAVALAGKADTSIIYCNRGIDRRYMSPDGLYVATLKVGEAEALVLRVSLASGKGKTVISEWDATGLIWDPGRPHRLIYVESGMYGKGKVAVWDGGQEKVLWHNDLLVDHLRWDRAHDLLWITTEDEMGRHEKQLSIPFQ